MTAIQHPPISIVAGDEYVHDFNLTDLNGVPINITGRTFSLKVFRDGHPIAVTSTVTITAPIGGTLRVTVPEAQTTLLAENGREFVARLRDDSLKRTVLSWPLEVTP